MAKHILIPAIALAGGGVGLALRRWELATAFEPDTGLLIPSAPATTALVVWSALVILALALLLRKVEKPCDSFEQAFPAVGNFLYITAAALSAFLLLFSAGAELVTYPTAGTVTSLTMLGRVLPPLRIALSALGFVGVLMFGKSLYRATGNGKDSLPLLVLCFLFCVWLIADYQSRSADPVTMNFIYELLAIITGLLGLYSLATCSFVEVHPRRTAFWGLLAAYFSLVTLADAHTLSDTLRFAFAILFLTTHAVLLLTTHPAGETPADTEADPNV